MSNISQQEYNKEKDRIARAKTIEEASASKYCSNCFMAMGLLHIAGGTILAHSKEFCSHDCLHEWESNQDECA